MRLSNSNKGFTLVEVLLAAAILAFVLSGLFVLFCKVIVLNDANRNKFIAASHCGFVMEDIKNTTFSNISSKIQNGDWDWNSTTITTKGLSPLGNEQIDASVSGSSVLDVSIVVSWLDRASRATNMTVSTKMVSP